jgi:hypothetical protein
MVDTSKEQSLLNTNRTIDVVKNRAVLFFYPPTCARRNDIEFRDFLYRQLVFNVE